MDENYQRSKHDPEDAFHVTQGVLTAESSDIACCGFMSSLKCCLGLPMCKATAKWVRGKKIGKGGLNIIIADFVECNYFIDKVIELNQLH